MGFVGFLDFVLKCIQLLSWPSFALGYPLCASIRAIETNSDFHMRKLVAYWIFFSLISLFEYAFSKLLEWVPVWPYVKILAIFLLVIPGFNGASIAYDNIVRPCLSMNLPQIIVDMLNEKQYVSLTRESFLEEAEKYVKENGTEALEKFFASKITTTVDADIKVNNAKLPEKLIENAFLVPPAFKNVQKEWTCALCQVTTQSEATLNSHLQGMKHRTKCEELKAGKQTATKKGVSTGIPNQERNCEISQVTTQSKTTWTPLHQEFIEGKQTAIKNNSSSTTIKSEQPNHDMKKVSSDSGINKTIISEPSVAQKDIKPVEILHKSTAAAENKIINQTTPIVFGSIPPVAQKDIKPVEILHKSTAAAENKITTTVDADIKVNHAKLPEKLTENAFLVPPAFKNVQKEWACAVCQVTTQSEASLNSHLQGMKHRTKCEELKAGKQTATKKGVSSGTPNKERNCAISQVTTQSKITWTSPHQEFIEGKQTAIKKKSSSTTMKSEQPNHHDLKKVSSDRGINKVSCANQSPKKSSSGSGKKLETCNGSYQPVMYWKIKTICK